MHILRADLKRPSPARTLARAWQTTKGATGRTTSSIILSWIRTMPVCRSGRSGSPCWCESGRPDPLPPVEISRVYSRYSRPAVGSHKLLLASALQTMVLLLDVIPSLKLQLSPESGSPLRGHGRFPVWNGLHDLSASVLHAMTIPDLAVLNRVA